MMLILLLMQSHKKLMVIEHAGAFASSWSNGAFCGFSTCTASVAGQWINTRSNLNTFNMLGKALTIYIVKI